MLTRITLLTSAVLILAFPVNAQQREYKPGINSVTIKNNITARPQVPEIPEPLRPDITARPKELAEKKREEENQPSASERIWSKYEKLATGTASQTEDNDKANPPPSVEEVGTNIQHGEIEQPAQKKNAGMNGLIDRYQQNIEQQKQMRSMHFNVPKDIKSETKNAIDHPQNNRRF